MSGTVDYMGVVHVANMPLGLQAGKYCSTNLDLRMLLLELGLTRNGWG